MLLFPPATGRATRNCIPPWGPRATPPERRAVGHCVLLPTPLLVRVPFYFSNVLESLRAATQKIFRLLLQLYHTTVYVVDQEPYRLLTLG